MPTYAYTSTPASCSQDTISRTALGSMVGLLMVLLAIVTTGWVWTCCWIMKKQGQMRINSSINPRWAKETNENNHVYVSYVILSCRFIQATNGNCDVHLHCNCSYATWHENESQPSVTQNSDRTYEVIPPLLRGCKFDISRHAHRIYRAVALMDS